MDESFAHPRDGLPITRNVLATHTHLQSRVDEHLPADGGAVGGKFIVGQAGAATEDRIAVQVADRARGAGFDLRVEGAGDIVQAGTRDEWPLDQRDAFSGAVVNAPIARPRCTVTVSSLL